VRSVCTTRAGGVSKAPFDSLNLGDHVGDAAADVAQNRNTLQTAISAKPVFLKQVHGTQIVSLNAETAHATEADACITTQSSIACTIMVADCLPVLLTNRAGSFVAAAHAGWRGLAGQSGVGVLEATVDAIQATKTTVPDIMAWLGPCIGNTQFEVGGEVRDAFASRNPAALRCFTPSAGGKWLADLRGLAHQRLNALGITQIYGNDGSAAWCTVSESSRFFSHRRDSIALGGSGRMAACIWLG
jgi:polyphenol oxidase